ncbi:hypothetical protein D3C75_1249180 [compost metagenome]
MGFGLGTIALEVHWHARQFIPGALVALQIHLGGGLGRNRARARIRTTGQQRYGE